MNVREALARVMHEAGSAPVRTELRPAEVAERARRRRRVAFAWRSLSVTGAAVLVIAALLFIPGIGNVQNPLYQPRPLSLWNGTEEPGGPQGTPSEPAQPPGAAAPGTQRPPAQDQQRPDTQQGQPGAPAQPEQPDRPPDGQDVPARPDELPDVPASPSQRDLPPGVPVPQPLPGDRNGDGDADTPTQRPDQQGESGSEQDGMNVMGMRACDPVQVGGTTYNVVVSAGEVPCGQARTVVRQAVSADEQPSGWTCQRNPAQDGIRCSSGENRVLAGQTR